MPNETKRIDVVENNEPIVKTTEIIRARIELKNGDDKKFRKYRTWVGRSLHVFLDGSNQI